VEGDRPTRWTVRKSIHTDGPAGEFVGGSGGISLMASSRCKRYTELETNETNDTGVLFIVLYV
jgi:hypothetical protein